MIKEKTQTANLLPQPGKDRWPVIDCCDPEIAAVRRSGCNPRIQTDPASLSPPNRKPFFARIGKCDFPPSSAYLNNLTV